MLNDTIAAISTALQDGAISVIRISGPDSLATVSYTHLDVYKRQI